MEDPTIGTLHANGQPQHQGIKARSRTDAQYARDAAIAANILLDKKWKVQVLCAMRSGSVRLGHLARLIPGASKKVLTQNLRQLEVDGIIVRTDKSDLVLHVEYALAERSRRQVLSLLDQLSKWGSSYSRSFED